MTASNKRKLKKRRVLWLRLHVLRASPRFLLLPRPLLCCELVGTESAQIGVPRQAAVPVPGFLRSVLSPSLLFAAGSLLIVGST